MGTLIGCGIKTTKLVLGTRSIHPGLSNKMGQSIFQLISPHYILNPKYSLGKYFFKNIVNSLLIFNNNTPLNLKILM